MRYDVVKYLLHPTYGAVRREMPIRLGMAKPLVLAEGTHMEDQISRMIRGALYDTHQIDGKGDLKADSNVTRVLGRVFKSSMVSKDRALEIADRLLPGDS